MTEHRVGVVVIVGRPNVGKSTLFNVLTQSRDAIVFDRPGLTRDRQYGQIRSISNADITIIDTGGLYDELAISPLVDEQIRLAIEESDLILFVTDARDGVTSLDEQISTELRKSNRKLLLVVNKIDRVPNRSDALSDFARLGLHSVSISATQKVGIRTLGQEICRNVPLRTRVENDSNTLPVAVIGRPNVGKSSLVNAISKSDRCVVFDSPGTTRDTVRVNLEHQGSRFEFADTAGIRKKGRTDDVIEKFSIVKALEALKRSQVSLLVIDAKEGVVEQDLHLVQYAIQAGAAIILVINKWDLLDTSAKEKCTAEVKRRLRFASWISIRFVSARSGVGVDRLPGDVQSLHVKGQFEIPTSELNRTLEDCVKAHYPPTVGRHVIRLRYANKVGSHPPRILIHGNQTENLPASYKRYLENEFRKKLDLDGWPIVLSFRTSVNPFGNLRNKLSTRQQKQRGRLIKHRKSAR